MNMRAEHPVLEDKRSLLQDNGAKEPGSKISRWRWRPGMKPRTALTIGVLFSVVGLLFVILGLVSLIAGIQDSNSAPLQVPGVVTRYTTNFLDSLPHAVIRVEKEGTTTTISTAVSRETAQALHSGDHVILDYSQRLHFPYALESGGHRYLLPGTSSAGNPFGSFALVLLGLVIFPYPAFLALWGWRDLHVQGGYTMRARIVGLRSSKQARSPQPGLTPRIFRTSYTLGLEPIDAGEPRGRPQGSPPHPTPHTPLQGYGETSPAASEPVDASTFREVVTFVIKEEMYRSLREGMVVEVMYSPNLHYVYALKQVYEGSK